MTPDDLDSEQKTASSHQESPGPGSKPEKGPCPICGDPLCGLSKGYEEYQAVSKQLLQAAEPAKTANPGLWKVLTPTGGPRTIFQSLDPRKGGEIHLSEAAVQLAMSVVNGGGSSSPLPEGEPPSEPGTVGAALQAQGKSAKWKWAGYYQQPSPYYVSPGIWKAYQQLLETAPPKTTSFDIETVGPEEPKYITTDPAGVYGPVKYIPSDQGSPLYVHLGKKKATKQWAPVKAVGKLPSKEKG